MIIVDDETHLKVITQPDHARLAGELLSLWRSDDLPDHPRREDLLFATGAHDNGWQEADSAPRVDQQTHRPLDFRAYPESLRLDVWQRGILRFAQLKPVVALLIAEHAEAIHQPLSEGWKRFFENLEPERQTWLAEAEIDRATIRHDYHFLSLADSLSLALCAQDPHRLKGIELEASLDGYHLHLSPCPLAGTTTFQFALRTIENRDFDSDSDLGSALARARWESKSVKVGPFPGQDA